MAEEERLEDVIERQFNAEPFQPFSIILTSGERLEIDSTVQLAIGTTTMALYRSRSGFTMFRKTQLVAIHSS